MDASLGGGVGDVGIGTLIGPTTGGLFAHSGMARRFAALAILAVAMSLLVPIALPPGCRPPPKTLPGREFRWSLVLLGLAALAVSAAAIPRNVAVTVGLLTLVGSRARIPRRRPTGRRSSVAAQRLGPVPEVDLCESRFGLLMARDDGWTCMSQCSASDSAGWRR